MKIILKKDNNVWSLKITLETVAEFLITAVNVLRRYWNVSLCDSWFCLNSTARVFKNDSKHFQANFESSELVDSDHSFSERYQCLQSEKFTNFGPHILQWLAKRLRAALLWVRLFEPKTKISWNWNSKQELLSFF